MRFVEFVGLIVALIALFAWIVGRPHTLESVQRDRESTAAEDSPNDGDG